MPLSDGATIAVSLVPAAIGATALLAAHQQRLRHEKEQADLAFIRELLAQGATSGLRIEQAARRFMRAQPPHVTGVRDRSLEELGNAVEDWHAYLATLQIVFGPPVNVLTRAHEVDAQATTVLREATRLEREQLDREALTPVVADLAVALDRFRVSARTHAGAER